MKHSPKNSKMLNRTKKIAATVAALGAAIGVNMSDVLAGSVDLQVAESGKAAISSQKIKKPNVLADKSSAGPLKRRPSAVGAKVERPGLKNRPDARADKSSRTLQKRPGSTNR
ncbi:MAG: hypothetical protein ACQ9IQ_13075 [Nitrospirales bacterium]